MKGPARRAARSRNSSRTATTSGASASAIEPALSEVMAMAMRGTRGILYMRESFAVEPRKRLA